MDKCYKEDPEMTNLLLTNELVSWSNWTCLSFAASADLKDFLSHTACQLLITNLWTGGMKLRKYLTIEVILGILFPPAIFSIEFRSDKERELMPHHKKHHEQSASLSNFTGSRKVFRTYEYF